MKQLIQKGKTSNILYVFIQNSSVSTGAGLTGLVFNSGGLTAYYVRDQGSSTAISLVTQTVTGAYSSGGFVEIDSTNMKGLYRLDVPDAVFATAAGVNRAVVLLQGATNMVPCVLEFQLTGPDLGSVQTIQRNQAYNNFMFLMTDNVNHAPATGKTVSAFRALDGGAFSSGTLSAVTEISAGWYSVNFAAADTNAGTIAFRATATGCDDTDVTILTVT